MAKLFNKPFAWDGDTEPLPDDKQISGKLSLAEGWSDRYETPQDDPDYLPVDRREMNGLIHTVTESLGEVQVNGFAKWQSIPDGWPKDAIVAHEGMVWKSLQDDATQAPGESSTHWGLAYRIPLFDNKTITVGSSGDFSTISDAIAYALRSFYPVNDGRLTVKLKTGFVVSEHVEIDGLNLGWVTIEGEDATTAITARGSVFKGTNGAVMPVINQLFDMAPGEVVAMDIGIHLVNCSRAVIMPGAGFKNCGTGLMAKNSSVATAESAIFSGCLSAGIEARSGSSIDAGQAICSGCRYGISASYASMINAQGADCKSAISFGIVAGGGSTVNANGADCSGFGTGIKVLEGGVINAYSVTGSLSETENTLTPNGIIFKDV
jgi:hypothetical protein